MSLVFTLIRFKVSLMTKLHVLIKPTNKFYVKIASMIGELQITSPIIAYNYNVFLDGITKYQKNKKVILLCIENENDLKYLSNLKGLLSSSKILILLPEKRKDMIKDALLLNPSLLLFANNKDAIKLLYRALADCLKG